MSEVNLKSLAVASTIVALLCAFWVGWMWGSVQAYQHSQSTIGGDAGAADRKQSPQQADTDHAGVPRFVERLISNPDPADGSEREKRDLAAQENTAAWAFWMVVFTAGGLVLSGFALFALLKTVRQADQSLSQARTASEATERIGTAQVRAYLSVKAKFLGRKTEDKFHLIFEVTNSGQSPARKAHLHVKFTNLLNGIPYGNRAEQIVPVGELAGGATLPKTEPFCVKIPADQIFFSKEDRKWTTFVFEVFAEYIDVFEEERTDRFEFRCSQFKNMLNLPIKEVQRKTIIRVHG